MSLRTNVPRLDPAQPGPLLAFIGWLTALVTGNRAIFPVAVLFTTNLAGTYANGTLGVGATLTKASAGAFPTTHGVVPFIGMPVLLSGQTTGAECGYYSLTVVGSSTVAWVLTRMTNFDASADMVQGTLFAPTVTVYNPATGANAAGDTSHQGEAWAFTGASSPVVGTDALTFAQTSALQTAGIQVITGTQQFAQDALQVLNSAGTFYTKFRSSATANRTATLPDATGNVMLDASADTVTGVKNFAAGSMKIDNNSTTNAHAVSSAATAARTLAIPDVSLTVAQAGVASGTPSATSAPAFTGTAPTAAENIATPVFSGTGQSSAGQVITTTDNQTMTLNQCAGMWFLSATHGPYLIASNTAVSGAAAVLTIYGTAPTTDAGTYKIITGMTPVGTVAAVPTAAHTHLQT